MVTPDKNMICYFEGCSLDRALTTAKELEGRVWGFGVYDLILMEGLNAVYQLKKLGKVFADLRIDSDNVDYLLQCSAAAGADITSIKRDSDKFTTGVASYTECVGVSYDYFIVDQELVGKDRTLRIVRSTELVL